MADSKCGTCSYPIADTDNALSVPTKRGLQMFHATAEECQTAMRASRYPQRSQGRIRYSATVDPVFEIHDSGV